ncbi:MAG: hypothetical protein L0Z73_15275 [Gammaproteobacteria bacterium]|nr:hypothetical protein [Gammaproteobacteria bacterium]
MAKSITFKNSTVTIGGRSWDAGKPVVDALWKNGMVLLIFDYMQYPENKVARNLEGFSENGERLWIAENPTDTPNEAYTEFLPDDMQSGVDTVSVGDLAGFTCNVDITTGKLINVVYRD